MKASSSVSSSNAGAWRGRALVTGGEGAGGLLSSITCLTAPGLGGDATGAGGRSVATDRGE